MIALLLALLIVYARWAPDSGLGHAMHRLTAKGLRRLAATRALTIVCFITLMAFFAGLIAYGKIEGLIIAGLAAPETFAMFLVLDVGTAVEVMVIAWLAAGRSNLDAAVRYAKAVFRTAARWTQARARRASPPNPTTTTARRSRSRASPAPRSPRSGLERSPDPRIQGQRKVIEP